MLYALIHAPDRNCQVPQPLGRQRPDFHRRLSLVRHGLAAVHNKHWPRATALAEYRIRTGIFARAMLPIDAQNHDALINALLPAVREAGRLEMAHFTKGVKFVQKADRSPVTAADHEAESVLLAALSKVAPDIPVVAEERISAGAACEYARRFFLVDALDGTRLFIRGKPEFSINIALVEDGKARFGLIFLPPSERLFVTRADGAAYEARLHLSIREQSPSVEFARISTRSPDPARPCRLQQSRRRQRQHQPPEDIECPGRAAARLVDEILPDSGGRRRPLREVRRNLRVGHRGRPSHTRGGGWIRHHAGWFAVVLRSLRTKIP